ncbi:MAG TPA: cytochrome c [Devosia sp.]|nr:cytochrome c [Devosia sp.]
MSFEIHRSAARNALALSVIAGSWLALSAFAPVGIEKPAAAVDAGRMHVAQAATAAAQKVHFSAEQAARGETAFEKNCVECHGEDLKGGLLGGAPLRGLSFEGKYVGDTPASALYDVMSTTMPPDSPGRYSPAVYADLMAYILKRNGFKPGADLPSDLDALDSLTMQK